MFRYTEITDAELACRENRLELARKLSPNGKIRPFKIDFDDNGHGGDSGHPTKVGCYAEVDTFIEQNPKTSVLETYKRFEH